MRSDARKRLTEPDPYYDPYYCEAFDTTALIAESESLRARIASLETTVIAQARALGQDT